MNRKESWDIESSISRWFTHIPIKLPLEKPIPKFSLRPCSADMSNSNPHKINIHKGYQRHNHSSVVTTEQDPSQQGQNATIAKRGVMWWQNVDFWRNNSQGQQQQTYKSDMLVAQTQPPSISSYLAAQEQPIGCSRDIDKYTSIFFSEGYALIPGSTTRIPITCSLKRYWCQPVTTEQPCTDQTSTGCEAIQGIDLETISMPLHKVHMTLQSDLVSGTVMVGIWPSLPIRPIREVDLML